MSLKPRTSATLFWLGRDDDGEYLLTDRKPNFRQDRMTTGEKYWSVDPAADLSQRYCGGSFERRMPLCKLKKGQLARVQLSMRLLGVEG